MKTEELVQRYQNGERTTAALLWDQVRRLCVSLVNKWKGYAEEPDLIQEAYIAMCNAAEDYDAAKGIPFSTYLAKRLQWHWARYVAQSGGVHIHDWIFWRIVQYKRAAAEWEKKHGAEPSEADLSEVLGLSVDDVRTIHKTVSMARLRYLDAPFEDDSELTLADVIPDGSDPFEGAIDKVQNEELAVVLNDIINQLSEDQAAAIRVTMTGEPLTEYAQRTKQAYSKVADRKAEAMRQLRRPRNIKRLQPFLPDHELYSKGVKVVSVAAFHRTGTSATERAALRRLLYEDD